MAFNDDPNEIQRRVNLEDRLRRQLEDPLARDFRRLFRQIGTDIVDMFTLTGRVVDAAQYIPDVSAFLRTAYTRTVNVFNHSVEDHIIDNQNDFNEELIAALLFTADQRGTSFDDEFGRFISQRNVQTQQFINQTIPVRVEEITRTNQTNIDRAITQAVTAAAETGEDVAQRVIAQDAGRLFTKNNLFRGAMIAETEILTASEGVKAIEVASFMAVSGALAQLQSEKIWVTMGDDKVRPSHVAVDFSVVLENEAFIVGGFPMQHPGDDSMGAPASEIVRCRCNTQYVIQ